MKAEDTVIRQQLKWLRNGMLFGFAPSCILYAAPYILGVPFSPYLNYAVLTLPLIPLTIAYAIVRYRLMDVDLISLRRGYAYTLATLCVLAAFYAIVLGVKKCGADSVSKNMSNTSLLIVMLIATFLFPANPELDTGAAGSGHFYRDRQ